MKKLRDHIVFTYYLSTCSEDFNMSEIEFQS